MGYTIWPDGYTGEALQEIYQERLRQEDLKREGRFEYTCADVEVDDGQCYMILGEEFGEVGHALNEMIGKTYIAREIDLAMLAVRDELIQVAAVTVAWIERIDKTFRARSTSAAALYRTRDSK
jgi:hypothetical protein